MTKMVVYKKETSGGGGLKSPLYGQVRRAWKERWTGA